MSDGWPPKLEGRRRRVWDLMVHSGTPQELRELKQQVVCDRLMNSQLKC